MNQEKAKALIDKSGLKDPVMLIGIRSKKRGVYDDTICIYAPGIYTEFRANVDPSRYRKGEGFGAKKGMASLALGVHIGCWFIGHHKKIKPAVRQGKPVKVIRDGITVDYPHTGMHMINFHPGGTSGTSSLGCQTFHPTDWKGFINLLISQLNKHKQKTISYILIPKEEA